MKKVLFVFIVLVASLVLALRHFRPDFSWFVEASGDDSTNIADINQPMPEVVIPGLGGDWVNTRSFGGKVLLISFWTTWCPGCRDEMPNLVKLQRKFGSQGFTVIAISVEIRAKNQ
jgi:thiol-disulfide isomerase/thioredoxin